LTNQIDLARCLPVIDPMLRRLVSLGSLLAALNLAHAKTLPSIQEFPFRFSEGLIWVRVVAPESGQALNFLIDSGASVNVLNLPTARKLGVKLGKKIRIQGVNGYVTGYKAHDFSAQIHNLSLPPDYLVVDLTKLSGVSEGSVDGLIGVDFFRDKIVQIDFSAEKIRLLDSAASNEQQQIVPLKMVAGGFLLSASVDHNPCQWFRLDTGCASSLRWVKGKLLAQPPPEEPSLGLAKSCLLQTYTTVETGSVCFRAVPTAVHSKKLFAGEAGLVGNGLLSRYASITVDAKSGRLLLENSRSSTVTGP
jgi:hypothetical protein